MSLQELSVHDVALRALPAIATAFCVHFALRRRFRPAPSLGGFLTWLSQLTDGMTTERMALACADSSHSHSRSEKHIPTENAPGTM